MNSSDLRKKFLDFFKARGHAIVPSSSLIPDDPSVLFTTAGMQQFKRYFTGELDPMKDFGSKNVVSIQKCFRTSDIDEVGDESHLTFFEMLGNFSFGGYWKKEAIVYAHEFIAKELGLSIDYVSIFEGDKDVPADEESEKIWKSLGIKDIRKFRREDNFWGPTGAEGPCGPTSEVYVRGLEVWNLVFNEYYCDKNKKLTPLKTKGIDTGMGLERLAMMVQNTPTIFETDLFDFLIKQMPRDLPTTTKRIIADHVRGIAFLISDGVRPSNREAGYVLRRLMRRVISYSYQKNIGISPETLLSSVVEKFKDISNYKNLDSQLMESTFKNEYGKFIRTVGSGLKELEKLKSVDAKTAFKLYESYGLPYEVIKEFEGGI
ncbi:MAG: alanine--tRNA ligase-related protein, partial [Patescibacteria group bacterium]